MAACLFFLLHFPREPSMISRPPNAGVRQQVEAIMKTWYTVALSMIAGAALGGAAIQGLHAQAKPKAYSISETEAVDAAAQAAYTPLVRNALSAAGGRSLRTAGGKVVHLEGAAPPKRAGITEWDSLEQAEAFYKSKAWADLAPQREKAQKVIRRYAVEVMN
jgi:uncharacterized protein (DUF1330 family)